MKIMNKELTPKTYHCNNCGAEVVHSYNHKCVYCGGLIDFNEPNDKVIELKPDDLVDISLKEVYLNYIMNNLVIILEGYKCPMPKIYEYNEENNTYISKAEEYINPPKCAICLEMPIYELKKYGKDYVIDRILNLGIRFNEIDRIMSQVLDNKEIRFFVR